MRHFKLTLSYDGTAYAGWQVQPNANTIQAEVERALRQIVGDEIRVTASGRTDAGVHALAQVASFSCRTHLAAGVLRRAIDANLPRDIVALAVDEMPYAFHAIRDSVRKRYRYIIQDGRIADVFAQRYAWQIPQRLDVDAMTEAARHLVGTHDFSSFEAAGAPRANSVRTVFDISLRRQSGELFDRIIFEIEANGFLYNMVRNIVGTLVEIGKSKQPPDWIVAVLAALDRGAAGPTAPAQGLFLVRVDTREDDELQ